MWIPFLPTNPNCSGCTPSTSSLGCNNPCNQYIANTNMVVYNGGELLNIDVQNCDSLTTVLQKINEAVVNQPTSSTTTSTSTTADTPSTTTSTTTGGGTPVGPTIYYITKAELDTLVSNEELVPGATYIISGVDNNLYDYDNIIIINAATTTKLELSGHGIFYTPKYINSQAIGPNGFGIWSEHVTYFIDSQTGLFTIGETITANNAATGTLTAYGFISSFSGDWSSATSITGGTSGATANISGLTVPSYSINDDVIWGGKHWTNLTGAIGSAIDKFNLDGTNWQVVLYDDVNYNISIDDIKYDQIHDVIIYRQDRFNNIVEFEYSIYLEFTDPNGFGYEYSPIQVFQWGNGNDEFNTTDYWYLGVFSNRVKDSYIEIINCRSTYISQNYFITYSIIANTIFAIDTYINLITNTIVNLSNFYIGENSGIEGIRFGSLSFDNSSIINSQISSSSYISISSSHLYSLNIFKISPSGTITINGSRANTLSINDNSIYNTILFSSCALTNVTINDNLINIFVLTNTTLINITFSNNTPIKLSNSGGGTISNTTISNNSLHYFGLNLSIVGTNLNSRTLTGLTVEEGVSNSSVFSTIFANSDLYLVNTSKRLQGNQGSTAMILTYYDGANTLQTVVI